MKVLFVNLSIRVILVPDLDPPLRSTGEEHTWQECVPLYVVDRSGVTCIGVEIL